MNVKDLQKKLNTKGYQLLIDGMMGPKTIAAIKDFQEKLGFAPDGLVGPATLKLLDMRGSLTNNYDLQPTISTYEGGIAIQALWVALSQNGVREQENNKGPAVNAFLASVGLSPGYSWCMAFVYWCFQHAAAVVGVMNPLVRTGGCMRQWNECPDNSHCQRIYKDPIPGDIFIMDLGGGAGHTGIVREVQEDEILTIEGNTNDNGSANGDGVYSRRRKKAKIKGYIRIK